MGGGEGTRFGGFIIGEILGRGGMGIVYRATRVADGIDVALKLMLPDITANRDFRDRFLREARITPSLDHPNIVSVYETGAVGSELFIAMELVEGYDLKVLIEHEGALPFRRAFSILDQAGDALDTAHESGVVHGDVKPQNLMISPGADGSERALLTDFGLIRPMGSESSASRSGAIFGSIQYMAPEQIEGLQADGRADVYSLACVAFEALTARIPFDRPNEIGVIWGHVHEDPPRVTDVNPGLPGGLNDVLRQAMAKHPDDRYLTCGEFIEALDDGARRTASALVPVPVRPLVNRKKRPKTEREVWGPNFFPELSRVRKLTNRPSWRSVATAIALATLVPVAITQFAHPAGVVGAATDIGDAVAALVPEAVSDAVSGSDEQERSRPEIREEHVGRPWRGLIAGSVSTADDPTQDPAVTADRSGRAQHEGPPVPRLGDALGDTKIVFASWRNAGSNRSVTEGEIYLMNADGTGLKRLTWTDPTQQEMSPAISPDATRVVFQRSSEIHVDNLDLYMIETEGSTTTRLTNTPECEFWPSWSPDGTKVLFGRAGSCLSGRSDLWLLDVKTGAERNLTANPSKDDWGGAWAPDGRRLVFTSNNMLYTMDGRGGPSRPIESDLGPTPGWDPDWCRGGWIVFTRTSGIWRLDLRTGRTSQLTWNSAQYGDTTASCSPDGGKVIFETFREGHWQLYMMDADGTNQTNVTRSAFTEHHADWQANF